MNELDLAGPTAIVNFNETDQGANLKRWRWFTSGGTLSLQTMNDAQTSATTLASWTRGGVVSFTAPAAGDVFLCTGFSSTTFSFTVDSAGRATNSLTGQEGAGVNGGAYFLASGYEEAFLSVYARLNTSGSRNLRFGNNTDRWVLQALNDAASAVTRTPVTVAATAPTDSLFVTTAGDVVFGTTTSGSQHVRVYDTGNLERGILVENTSTGNAASSIIRFTTGAQTGALLRFGTGHATNANELVLLQPGNFPIAFWTTNTVRMTISGGGNVGIGTATFPSTGTAGLVFGDGTALATMGSNTAGLYANDVSGTVHMFTIAEDNTAMRLIGSVAVYETTGNTGAVTNAVNFTPAAASSTYQLDGVVNVTAWTTPATFTVSVTYKDASGNARTDVAQVVKGSTGVAAAAVTAVDRWYFSFPAIDIDNSATAITLSTAGTFTGTPVYNLQATLTRVR